MFLLIYIRLFLAPIFYSLYLILIKRIKNTRGSIWILLFFIASFITLLPTPLLEFRYFTPSLIILILNSPIIEEHDINLRKKISIFINISIFLLINILTIYIFLYNTFIWPDQSLARFMF
jgi:alpha-1,2-glucosyltransferase